MATPNSPEGFTPYEQYSFPKWLIVGTLGPLLGIAIVVIFSKEIMLYPKSSVKLIVATGFAIAASLFIHESLHYVANSALGYNPVYVWPNMVCVPGENLDFWEATVALLAPQILTVLYVVLLLTKAVNSFKIIIGWGLILNLGGAASDVAWVLRRATWPDGTKVVVGDDHENYVAFPKDGK